MEGSKIIEVKGHGLGYLMSPASSNQPDWMEAAWRYILRLDHVFWDKADPPWLDYPAMMKIPVSSPAVLGRLKGFCKPFDFVLAPILRIDKLDPEERAEKPILITRFNKHPDEWLGAIYYNVRTGKKCGITTGDRRKGRIPVKTYREILHQYLYHPECKFAGPDGRPCDPWTRGVLQRRHIVAEDFKYCGKEVKRKLEQGPVDHEIDCKCKVCENGRVGASLYARFSSLRKLRPPFDFGVFISPILISPILFVPLYETLSNVVTPSKATGMLILVAFENGFFFKGYFDQRRALHHEEKGA
jgi:hypothetical protein